MQVTEEEAIEVERVKLALTFGMPQALLADATAREFALRRGMSLRTALAWVRFAWLDLRLLEQPQCIRGGAAA